MRRIVLEVSDSDAKVRLDVWLARHIPELSRSRIQGLIKSGYVTVRGMMKVLADTKVVQGMRVYVEIPHKPLPTVEPEKIELPILFEDSDIIVINKPAGMVVHPAPGHSTGTLVNALLYHCPELKCSETNTRPGIVHRLDRDTSGVMVVAKSELAMMSLANQFKHKAVTKHYIAIVWGTPRPVQGTVETLIGRNKADRKRMQSMPITSSLSDSQSVENTRGGRYARTSYIVLQDLGLASLLRVQPYTGRTHQIRVHMAYIGHAVLGDKQYGRRQKMSVLNKEIMLTLLQRQMLHSEMIAFTHPSTGRHVEFSAQMPEDMEAVLDMLRRIKNAEDKKQN